MWPAIIKIKSQTFCIDCNINLTDFNFNFQDFLAQLKEEKKRQKTLWKIDIELREPSEDPIDSMNPDEDLPVVILDDTEEPTMSSSDNTKQVTFSNTTSSHEMKDTSEEVTPPKKTSRIVWQEHVEIME